MQLYYKAKITKKPEAEGDRYIVELGWSSEDGYECYTVRNTGFDPAAAEALAKAWRSGQHRGIMLALESEEA